MGYLLLKGEFHLFYEGQNNRHVGSRPDGDSVWFKPNKPHLLDDVGGRSADFNGGGFVQLRVEGIDALELHYQGSNHQLEQPTVSARDTLLGMIGFDDVEYAPNADIPSSVRDATPHPRPGYILTRSIDPFGRPVAFVFAGSTSQQDGSDIWLDVARLNTSLNAQLMSRGEVYPAYYAGLPSDLRDRLTDLAFNAWSANRGLWPVDRSNRGARIRKIDDLSRYAIWPKLYRRLFKYFRDPNTRRGVAGFDDWLRDDPNRDDDLWIIPTAEISNLHDVVEVTGTNRITMTYFPEELVIVPG
ncbi:MAG: hypothetical protein IIA64_03775 [Planctomycetes bacterium]|nr:hypothetical protein [Planctomycetota bacterium]